MREGSPARPKLNLRAEDTCPGVPYFHLFLSRLAFGPPPGSRLDERSDARAALRGVSSHGL